MFNKMLLFMSLLTVSLSAACLAEESADFRPTSSAAAAAAASPSVATSRLILGCVQVEADIPDSTIRFLSSLSISTLAQKLLEDVTGLHGTIALRIGETRTGACWHAQTKEILISQNHNNLLVFAESFLWELCNAANPHFQANSFLTEAPSADLYAFCTEAAEFLTQRRRSIILKSYWEVIHSDSKHADLRRQVESALPFFKRLTLRYLAPKISFLKPKFGCHETFSNCWSSVNRVRYKRANGQRTSHAELYRKQWLDYRKWATGEGREPIVEDTFLERVRPILKEAGADLSLLHPQPGYLGTLLNAISVRFFSWLWRDLARCHGCC